jgi:hypothetical protein
MDHAQAQVWCRGVVQLAETSLTSKGSVMAHREQRGNREAKKPKKEKPQGGVAAGSKQWAVSEIVEARTDSKH